MEESLPIAPEYKEIPLARPIEYVKRVPYEENTSFKDETNTLSIVLHGSSSCPPIIENTFTHEKYPHIIYALEKSYLNSICTRDIVPVKSILVFPPSVRIQGNDLIVMSRLNKTKDAFTTHALFRIQEN